MCSYSEFFPSCLYLPWIVILGSWESPYPVGLIFIWKTERPKFSNGVVWTQAPGFLTQLFSVPILGWQVHHLYLPVKYYGTTLEFFLPRHIFFKSDFWEMLYMTCEHVYDMWTKSESCLQRGCWAACKLHWTSDLASKGSFAVKEQATCGPMGQSFVHPPVIPALAALSACINKDLSYHLQVTETIVSSSTNTEGS